MKVARKSPYRVLYPELQVPHVPSFLNRLESAVADSEEWQVATNHAPFPAVVAQFNGVTFKGSGLVISACAGTYLADPRPETIIFAVIADRWGDDASRLKLVSDSQLNGAFMLFRPLVRAVCRDLGIRCRLTYPRTKRLPAISPETASRLDAFCIHANHACLHPLDWRRFYSLVCFCHARRVKLDEAMLAAELCKRGMSESLSKWLAERYAFGRELLSNSDNWLEW